MTAASMIGRIALVVAGELEREHDRGERRPGRGAERRGHRDQRDRAGREVQARVRCWLIERAEQAAERAADEQDRGERAARRARSERDPPRHELGDQQRRERADRELVRRGRR